jgi:hypothetical protein
MKPNQSQAKLARNYPNHEHRTNTIGSIFRIVI